MASERELEKVAVDTRHERRSLHGKDAIGMHVDKVSNRHKVDKFCVTTISEEAFTCERGLEKIVI